MVTRATEAVVKSCFSFSGKIWFLLFPLLFQLPANPAHWEGDAPRDQRLQHTLLMSFIVIFFKSSPPFLLLLAPPKSLQLSVAWELEYTEGAGYERHHWAGLGERGQRCDAAVTGTWRGSGIDEFFKPEVFSRMVDR